MTAVGAWAGPAFLTAIAVEDDQLTLKFDKQVKYETSLLDNPARLIIDCQGATFSSDGQKTQTGGGKYLKDVRAGKAPGDESEPEGLRVIAALNSAVPYQVSWEGTTMKVRIGTPETSAAAPEDLPPAAKPPELSVKSGVKAVPAAALAPKPASKPISAASLAPKPAKEPAAAPGAPGESAPKPVSAASLAPKPASAKPAAKPVSAAALAPKPAAPKAASPKPPSPAPHHAVTQGFELSGTITDAGGKPAHGTYRVQFTLLSPGEQEVWNEFHAVTARGGKFRTLFDKTTPLPEDPAAKLQILVQKQGFTAAPAACAAQVAAFKDEQKAKALAESLKPGFPKAGVSEIQASAGKLFAVRIGPLDDTLQGQIIKRKLEAQGYQPILVLLP